MAETLTVDTTPDTEVLTADEQESLEIGEQMEAQQNNLLAGKYKDAQELEKAYIELQGKLGEPKEEKEDTSKELEKKEETKETDSNFLDRLWDEAQTEYTDETMQELSKMSSQDLAEMHLKYRSDNQNVVVTEKQVSQLKDVAGGAEKYTEMIGWAENNLQKEEIAMYDKVMDKGDPLACYFAVQALKYRFDDASGVEGRMLTGKAPSNQGSSYQSQAQLVEAMEDPRYESDTAYRQDVMQKLERSNLQF